MKTLKEQRLQGYFATMARETGHGDIASEVLMLSYNGTGYTEHLLSHGITPQMFPKILIESERVFKALSGMPFRDFMRKKSPIPLNYTGPKPDKNKTHFQSIDAIGRIYDIGYRYLTDEELFCICAIDLYKSTERIELEDLAATIDKNPFTAKGIYRKAKQRLIDALKQEAPELENHPFLARKTPTKQRIKQSGKEYKKFNITTLPTHLKTSDQYIHKLYKIADTIFAPDQRDLFVFAYLRKNENSRLALNDPQRRNAVKLAKKVSEIADFESDSVRLKALLTHTDVSTIRAAKHLDSIDETKIDTDVCFVRLFYEILLKNARHGETAAFVNSRLYRAEDKLSPAEISKLLGIEENTVDVYTGDSKTIIRSELHRLNSPLTGHPLLQNQKHSNEEDDVIAKSLLKSGCFEQDILTLRNSDLHIMKIARTVLNARSFYILFASDLSAKWNKLADTGKALDLSYDHTATILSRARKRLVEALAFEDPSKLTRSKFLIKMKQLNKYDPEDHFTYGLD